MTRNQNYRLRQYTAAGFLLAALAGCGPLMIQSDPNTFAVAPEAGAQLRGPQSISLNNSYNVQTQVQIFDGGRTWQADLKQYTETAIAILDREMTKKSISNTAAAAKSMTLRVRDVHANLGGWVIRASLVLDAEYGDGTKSTIETSNSSPGTAWRAVDGAIMFAVTRLLRDDQFLAYLNR
jgi:hypothetical protein